ncbi:hypothetical protein [Nocardia sp. NPDC052566]|uniref:hypothetical protein n=1 Tax=Nocardia sp. NPDC052566 TaxID=3364330 RepID=UPI0037C55652
MYGVDIHRRRRACATETGVAVGTHGMTVFGTGIDCYLSHRASFQAPDNFQILLSIELDERGQRALGTDRRIGYDGVHTFEPVGFPLAELDPRGDRPRTEFDGTLVRGRPERGGIPIARDVRATVRSVVYFAELDPVRPGEVLTHLCFGRPGRLYLAHRIARRPSFDQIVSARLIPGTVADLAGIPLRDDAARLGFPHAQPIILGQREFSGNRLRVGEIAVAAFNATAPFSGEEGFLVEVAIDRQIYLEVADLV